MPPHHPRYPYNQSSKYRTKHAIKFSPEHSTITIKVSISIGQSTAPLQAAADEVRGPSRALGHTKIIARDSFKRLLSAGNSFKPLIRLRSTVATASKAVAPEPAAANEICWITIVVCDQGVGIPDHLKCKLFQYFSQIDAQSLQQGQGSGLGLVFAQQIIELHGGEVVFDSTVGVGSTFGFKVRLSPVC